MFMHALVALALTAGSLTNPPSSASPAHTSSDSVVHRKATFGVAIAPVPDRIRQLPYLEENEGVVLTEVRAGGAADAAALKAGDILLTVDGHRVDETTLFATLRDCPKNQSVRVELLRGGKWKEASVEM